MSAVVIRVTINGAHVPLELDDAALAAIADALPPPLPDWPPWMSAETASLYLDCPTQRLYKLVQRQQVPHTRDSDGGRIFFERSALDQWMHAKTNGRSDTR